MSSIKEDTIKDIVHDYTEDGYTLDDLANKYNFTRNELHIIVVQNVPCDLWGADIEGEVCHG